MTRTEGSEPWTEVRCPNLAFSPNWSALARKEISSLAPQNLLLSSSSHPSLHFPFLFIFSLCLPFSFLLIHLPSPPSIFFLSHFLPSIPPLLFPFLFPPFFPRSFPLPLPSLLSRCPQMTLRHRQTQCPVLHGCTSHHNCRCQQLPRPCSLPSLTVQATQAWRSGGPMQPTATTPRLDPSHDRLLNSSLTEHL